MIECAAIRTTDGVVFSVDKPGRHHDVIKVMREKGYEGPVGGIRQGFLVSGGRFVTREEALSIAIEAGQVEISKCVAPKTGLFSEDVW